MSRGCGVRSPGGIYIEVLLSERGVPLHTFILDPPVPVPANMAIPDRGVLIQERVVGGEATGIFDVYDHVGTKYYPNVADMIAEIGGQGLSRRVGANTALDKLTPQSLIILVHDRAIIDNHDEVYAALIQEEDTMSGVQPFRCPCCVPGHSCYPRLGPPENATGSSYAMCAGLWFHDVSHGSEAQLDPKLPPRAVSRTIGSVTYSARRMFPDVTPRYTEGLFMALPITRLAVIRDPVGGSDAKAVEKASQSGLDVGMEDF